MKIVVVAALALLAASRVGAEDAGSAPAAPVERADDLRNKLTASVYLLPSNQNYDLNVRHKFGAAVGWLGSFVDATGQGQARVGGEYDFQRGPVLVVPTLQIGSNGLVAGQLYSELGGRAYAIAGYSRTNLKPFYNLSFDPNESVQLGGGWHVSGYDRVYGFVIFDVRLHTSQEDTHVLWRHRLDAKDGVTLDALFKSGRLEDGRKVDAAGVGVYFDRPTWFVKAYYDPFVNFTADRMLRVGVGCKF